MKRTQNYLLLSLLAILFVFSSCATVLKDYGVITTHIPVVYEGKVKTYNKKESYEVNDIVLNGRTRDKFELEDFYEDILYQNEESLRWAGSINAGGTYSVEVDYRINKDHRNRVRNVDIKALPNIYQFTRFDITNAGILNEELVYESELPFKLTSFTIEGKSFYILLTSINSGTFPEGGDTPSTVYALVQMPAQRFHIVDNAGIVYAEFTQEGYKIFDVPYSETKPELFLPCIAVFSIVKNLHSSYVSGWRMGT
jgi:hypothetical protein